MSFFKRSVPAFQLALRELGLLPHYHQNPVLGDPSPLSGPMLSLLLNQEPPELSSGVSLRNFLLAFFGGFGVGIIRRGAGSFYKSLLPATHYADQASLELTAVCLFLPL